MNNNENKEHAIIDKTKRKSMEIKRNIRNHVNWKKNKKHISIKKTEEFEIRSYETFKINEFQWKQWESKEKIKKSSFWEIQEHQWSSFPFDAKRVETFKKNMGAMKKPWKLRKMPLELPPPVPLSAFNPRGVSARH